ncbi:MAG: hypothetical protein ACOCVN_02930, partial [bacterium]
GSYSVQEGNPIYQGIAGSIDNSLQDSNDALPDNDDPGAENLIRLVAGNYLFLIEGQSPVSN